MIEIVEISQCYGEDIIAYSKSGKERVLTYDIAKGAIEAAKKRFNWYFCPFDDIVLDYRFERGGHGNRNN